MSKNVIPIMMSASEVADIVGVTQRYVFMLELLRSCANATA